MIEYRPVIVGKKKILRIDVPAADRHDKPVYIGTDPMKGYRIIFEQLHSGHPWNALENDELLNTLLYRQSVTDVSGDWY